MLDEGLAADDCNGSTVAAEKKFSINFSKVNTIFWLSLHHSCDKSYLFVDRKGSVSLKLIIKM